MSASGLKVFFKYKAIQLRKYVLANFPSLISTYYRNFWTPRPNSLAATIDQFSKENEHVFCIQVGSNDGFQHDPLCKFIKRDGWKGLLFEPQIKAFKTLKSIYKKDQVIPVNKAIDHKINTKKLYRISFTDARWASGLSSFEPKQLQAKVEDGYIDRRCKKEGIIPPAQKEDYITFDVIECVTFESMLKKYEVDRVDLLQIDTEGYDFEILKLFDFDTYQPQLVIFEKTHLGEDTYEEAKAYLEKYGYEMGEKGADAVGVRRKTSLEPTN